MYIMTTAAKKIRSMRKRIRVVQGGTSASKTVSIMLFLIAIAQKYPDLTISVVAETMPHLKKGAQKDFLMIMKRHKYYKEELWNRTDHIYTFETGTIIEFFSADSEDKVRGPRRDILFINECNNVKWPVYDQLEVRTRLFVILDYNPVGEFWVHEEIMPHMEHDFIKLTYLDNEGLDKRIVASIESRKHNVNWWRVYGLGETGAKEGQVYPDEWEQVDEVPEDAILLRHGVDFGYTNDPTAIVDLYKWNGGYLVDEVAYGHNMRNREIANYIRRTEGLSEVSKLDNSFVGRTKVLTIADSSEPKSIDDIDGYGVKITGATKGGGSVENGIDIVQDQLIRVTKRSTNVIKEKRNYLWKVDRRTGKNLNIPEDDFNHAMDAIRYVITDVATPKKKSGGVAVSAGNYDDLLGD